MKQAQTDELYDWIKKVICSCDDFFHIEPCSGLIDIFERKNPPEYLVKSLRELLKIHEKSISKSEKKSEKLKIDDRIFELFNSGHSVKDISAMLDMKNHQVLAVVNNKLGSLKKK